MLVLLFSKEGKEITSSGNKEEEKQGIEDRKLGSMDLKKPTRTDGNLKKIITRRF